MSNHIKHAPIAGLETRILDVQSNHTSVSQTSDQIAQEAPIALTYNGQSHAVMMASPIDLADFAVGFSLTERVIDTPAQIKHIEINHSGAALPQQAYAINLQIDAKLLQRLNQQRRQISGRSGCGICGISDLAAAIPVLTPLSARAKPSHGVIDKAINNFNQNQQLQSISGATHAAALYSAQGELLELREDIGRHNALDKLIGARLAVDGNGFADDDFIVMSSRASHELINKTVIAGVGSLVCISAATSLAIDLAQQLNLNLIGFVREQRQLVYYQNTL